MAGDFTTSGTALNLFSKEAFANLMHRVVESPEGGKNYFTADSTFFDPNPQFSITDLIGDIHTPGLYSEMALANPIISRDLKFRQNLIEDTELELLPADANIEASIGLMYIDHIFRTSPTHSLNTFIAEASYQSWVFGFALYEIVINEDQTVSFYSIRPQLVDRWELDEYGEYTGVFLKSTLGGKRSYLPAYKTVRLSRSEYAENLFGVSLLRPLVPYFLGIKSTLQNYFIEGKNTAGFLTIQEVGETSEQSWLRVRNFLEGFHQGSTSPLLLDKNMEVQYVSTHNGRYQDPTKVFQYFDEQIKVYLNDSIRTLTTSGSRALGEAMVESDDVLRVYFTISTIRFARKGLKVLMQHGGLLPDDMPVIGVCESITEKLESGDGNKQFGA